MSHHNSTKHHGEKLDDVHSAQRRVGSHTHAQRAQNDAKSAARKEHSCGTTNALSKISGHAKGTITAATALGSQTSPGCDGKYRYWLSARQVLQSSFPSPEELIEQSVKSSQRECRAMLLDSPLPLAASHAQAEDITPFT